MNETVLIVDDSLTVRMDLADAFSAAGFSPVPCSTIAEARTQASRAPVSVFILDVVLPDADGVDFLKEIRRSATAAIVVMLSSEAEVKDRIRGLQTGADEYVGKPYDAGYLVARVRELLHARQGRVVGDTTILIVDDSPTFREELRLALESNGYRVLTATSGEEGLQMAAAHRPSAIVVDGVLPGIDGATVIRRVRLDAVLRNIPCLLLTAAEATDNSAELRALDAGADTFLRKEEALEVMLAKLAAVVRRATARTTDDDDTRSLLGPKKILAIDDSPTYLHEVADALRGEGYDVVLAHSGEEAIELLSVQAVDCILLDLVMPGLGGYETCQRIKTAPIVRDVPLILLTALESQDAMIHGLGSGADDYIPKSSEFEVLKARVRAQIRRKQFEDENRRIREELLRKELEVEASEARAARDLAEARATLIRELERKNKELEAFSYSVSHDLRTPLRTIDGFGYALLEKCAGLDDKARGYLTRMRAAAQRMGEIIDALLDLSRVANAELERSHIDLSALARAIAADARKREPHRHVEIRVEDGLVVDGDARLMKVVLENLIENSWKFTTRVAQATIEVGAEMHDAGPVYFIRDNGVGFDMAYVEKLFRPFQRLHSQGEFPGTGIGLATVQRVIDRHGGRIWAEGAADAGATVYFTIPAASPGARI
jgi:DNA-binding response OmpR family regulator